MCLPAQIPNETNALLMHMLLVSSNILACTDPARIASVAHLKMKPSSARMRCRRGSICSRYYISKEKRPIVYQKQTIVCQKRHTRETYYTDLQEPPQRSRHAFVPDDEPSHDLQTHTAIAHRTQQPLWHALLVFTRTRQHLHVCM